MHLALNTFIYEVAKVPIEQALLSAGRLGFRFISGQICAVGIRIRIIGV